MTVGLTRDSGHVYRWNGGPPMPGVTGIQRLQDNLGGSDGLVTWAAGLAADEIIRQVEAQEPLNKSAAYRAVRTPANVGSAVHEAFDKIIRGEAFTPDDKQTPFFYGIAGFLAAERPEFVASEQMVANLSVGFGGTFDFVARLRGELAMVDVKSGKLKASYALQLAGYTLGEFVGKEGDPNQYPMPKVRAHYVLLLRPDGYELVPMTVGRIERRHFLYLAKTYNRLLAWGESQLKEVELVAA